MPAAYVPPGSAASRTIFANGSVLDSSGTAPVPADVLVPGAAHFRDGAADVPGIAARPAAFVRALTRKEADAGISDLLTARKAA
jgi:hypothetical protein